MLFYAVVQDKNLNFAIGLRTSDDDEITHLND